MDKALRIMVVDDESIVGRRLKPALEKSGYEVEVFEDGKSAVDRIAREPFDIVVTDVRMDEIDGMQVLQQVLTTSPRTKVIIITGYATVELAREALIKGALKRIRPGEGR
jgi:DNA-binding NtrC family response regulator